MQGHEKIIELLNARLADELTAVNQYMVHAEMCDNWGYEHLHEAIQKRAIDEMKHAEKLIGRILFLEGRPIVSTLREMHIGAEVPKMFQNDLGLVVVGDGPLRDDLIAQAKRLGVDDRIAFAGAVAKERVPAYLRACDVFVLNSTYEGLPHVLLEAMAAGLPVIATAVGGSREIIEDGTNGLLIPPHDPLALKQALLRMLSTPAERMSMVQRGRDTLAKFSLQTMVEQTEATISAVIQAHGI